MSDVEALAWTGGYKTSKTCETVLGYTRVQLYRDDLDSSWRLATYNMHDSTMNFSKALRTKDLEEAKRRAAKYLLEILADRADTVEVHAAQLKLILE